MGHTRKPSKLKSKTALAYMIANMVMEGIGSGPNRRKKKPHAPSLQTKERKEKLKIALVTEYYFPHVGGITTHIEGFARYCIRQGHEVKIITPYIGTADYPIPLKEHITYLAHSMPIESNDSIARFSLGFGLGRRVRKLLSAEKFDVVHCHGVLYGSLYFLFHKFVQDELMIGTLHTNFDYKSKLLTLFREDIQKHWFDDFDYMFAVSRSALDSIERYVKCGPHEILPNGIDLSRFRAVETLPPPKMYDPNRFTVTLMGRLEPRNGMADAIKVLDILRRTHGIDAEFVIIGEGPEKQQILKTISTYQLEPYVKMLGNIVSGKEHYLVHADALLCTHKIASHSYILIEFLAAGKPVVATTDVVDYNREMLDGGVLAFNKDRPEEAAVHLAAIAKNPLLGSKLSHNAMACAEEYSWDKVGAKTLAVYFNLLEQKRWAHLPTSVNQEARSH